MNFIILFSFFLFRLSTLQSCCAATSCYFGYKCFCNDISASSTCLGEISSNRRSYDINGTPRGFFFLPSNQEYQSIEISTCFTTDTYFGYALVGVTLQSTDGIIQQSNLTYYSTAILPRCSSLQLSSQKFRTKSNGEFQSVVLYMSTTNSQNASVSIQVTITQTKKQNIIIPIMIGVSTFVLTILITFSIWCIYRRFRSATDIQENLVIIVPQNAHIEVHMPALPLSQIKNRFQGIQEQMINCTVCLVDITNSQSARRSPCGHIFHQQCIDQWCRKNLNCPLCRYPLDKQSLKKQTDCPVDPNMENRTQLVMVNRDITLVNN